MYYENIYILKLVKPSLNPWALSDREYSCHTKCMVNEFSLINSKIHKTLL